MIDEATAQTLRERLFADPKINVLAVLDGASIGRDLVMGLWEHDPEHCCLLPGELEPDMAEVAPYLVRLEPGSKFAEWVLREGWGNHWGIFATGRGTLHLMRGHFRSLINVYDPDGQPLLFRYYDPRVLRVYLPTCNADETREFFGPVTSYVMEDEDGEALLRFTCRDGTPHREEIPLGAKRA